MERFTDRLAGRLSGGMKQKLSLACALVRRAARAPARRADDRRRPGVAPRVLGRARAPGRGRADDPRGDAVPRRGRALPPRGADARGRASARSARPPSCAAASARGGSRCRPTTSRGAERVLADSGPRPATSSTCSASATASTCSSCSPTSASGVVRERCAAAGLAVDGTRRRRADARERVRRAACARSARSLRHAALSRRRHAHADACAGDVAIGAERLAQAASARSRAVHDVNLAGPLRRGLRAARRQRRRQDDHDQDAVRPARLRRAGRSSSPASAATSARRACGSASATCRRSSRSTTTCRSTRTSTSSPASTACPATSARRRSRWVLAFAGPRGRGGSGHGQPARRAGSSAWPSAPRSCTSRACCSSTSRPRASIRSPGARSGG